MFEKRVYRLFIVPLTFLLLVGCGEYEKLLKSKDYELKYDKALEYYEDEDYVRASTLLDQVVNIYRGTMKADTVKYYQAMSYYGQRDYILAGHYFQQLSTTYTGSAYLEESEFMSAYCSYMQSPRPSLDQTSTFQAINAFKMYMTKYPNSDKIPECKEILTELNNKIVEKSFNSSRLYYDLGYYKSAIISLRNSLESYPDTKYREDILYLILRSSYLLADNSVESKRKERFQSTIDEYFSFASEFPESDRKKDAEKMYRNSQEILDKYTSNN